MNDYEFNCELNNIKRIIFENKDYLINIKYRMDCNWLEVYKIDDKGCLKEIKINGEVYPYFMRVENISLTNFKQILSSVKKDRLDVNEIKILY